MEKITFASADSQENEEFFVLEQTKLNGFLHQTDGKDPERIGGEIGETPGNRPKRRCDYL